MPGGFAQLSGFQFSNAAFDYRDCKKPSRSAIGVVGNT
jgi:hypothetical protein